MSSYDLPDFDLHGMLFGDLVDLLLEELGYKIMPSEAEEIAYKVLPLVAESFTNYIQEIKHEQQRHLRTRR